ncbi:MAG TPA: hypothetical protein VMG12_29955 [Polyangiaceae bacterium]|nr:hypothetical protein [Polyangiaceae bacterium]
MLAGESARGRAVLGGMVVAGFVGAIPGLALAQTPAPSAEAPAAAAAEPAEPAPHIDLTGGSHKIDLAAPPPPAPVGRSYRMHDGFYVRVGGGLGTLGADVDQAGFDASSGGVSMELEALVGGSPAAGLTIGGGVLAGLQLGGEWEADGIVGSQSANLTTFIIGPFADGHPMPSDGWHVGGLLGLASVSFDGPGGGDGSDALGVGGAGWVGYDFWVAPQWSIGAALRIDAMRATNSDDDLTISKLGGTLSVSVLYN